MSTKDRAILPDLHHWTINCPGDWKLNCCTPLNLFKSLYTGAGINRYRRQSVIGPNLLSTCLRVRVKRGTGSASRTVLPFDKQVDLSSRLQVLFEKWNTERKRADENVSKKKSQCFKSLLQLIYEKNLQNMFPNMEIVLRIVLSIAVTDCSSECSFSVLKRVKNIYELHQPVQTQCTFCNSHSIWHDFCWI